MPTSSAFFFAGILALSVSNPHSTFRYEQQHSLRRIGDDCRICYGDDCVEMGTARCEYYVEADEVMEKPEENGGVTAVDALMSDLTEQALMSWSIKSCIPLISYYTNCNKENFCIGCQTCHCNEAGVWVCSIMQWCRPDVQINVDHRILIMVQEKLLENEKKPRKKRLIENVTNKSEMKSISLLEIADWMYGVTPNTDVEGKTDENNSENTTKATHETEFSPQFDTTPSTPTEYEYLGFEEVLKNIDMEDQIYKRRKPYLKVNHAILDEYVDADEYKVTKNNASDQFISALNAIEEGKDVTESIDDATFVVDLFPRMNKNYFYGENNTTDNLNLNNDIIDNIYPEINKINSSHGGNDLDKTNIIKRDVAAINSKTETSNYNTTTKFFTSTTPQTKTDETSFNLNNNVLIPLTNIIDEKQAEVKELLKIKENLIHFITEINNTDANITKNYNKINNSSTYFSIYKLDLFPEIQENLRKNNLNTLDKMLYKLKRDIYEVLKDIAWIQKISKTRRGLPDDLKTLIRSMKYYVSKQGGIRNFGKKNIKLLKINNNTRRFLLNSAEIVSPTSIKRQLYNILEMIDKESLVSNSLVELSKSPRKIIKRVIKQKYTEDFSTVGFKVFDSEYNLTNDLRTIGKSWPQMTANVANCSPHEKLYAMKLLHFTLATDMNKIKDAITLVSFAHSRRMSPIETPMADELTLKINTGLAMIKTQMQSLMQNYTGYKRSRQEYPVVLNKKESLIKRLRNMLRSSKKEIINLAKKKIPKSEIFKTIAKKKLNELSMKKMSEDEQTMIRWQKKLNIARRKKRDLVSHFNKIKKRIKNIIPKYLQGKVNPALLTQKTQQHSETMKTTRALKSTTKPTTTT